MKMKHLAAITGCVLSLAAFSAFADVNDPVFVIQNKNTPASGQDGSIGVIMPNRAFEQYSRDFLINDTTNKTTTTIYVPTSDKTAADTTSTPSLVAGEYDDQGAVAPLQFYVMNEANDTYCGVTYTNIGGQYHLVATQVGSGDVGSYAFKCPVAIGSTIPMEGNGYFKFAKSKASGGPLIYTISFSNSSS